MRATTHGRHASGSLLGARLALVIGSLALVTSQCAEASFLDSHGDLIDVVSTPPNTNTSQVTVWRIDQPNIAQLATNYPQIQFQPGDRFKVLAGGCDQTGGMGHTWKRYVYPQGDNTNVLYHGLILVPEALPAAPHDPGLAKSLYNLFSRLGDFGVGDGLGGGVPVEHYIPDPLPDGRNLKINPLYLSLGFEDDGYSDNGYYARDPGNNDQCVNVPPSYVIITIGHHGAIPPDPRLYIGIKPDDFECQAGWAFVNQGTPELSYATFQTAFQITWAGKYLNPFNEILYQSGKGLASSGNCEGMALLSVAGEDQFVVGDIKESFWHNYRYALFSQTPANIQFDINVAHWQQLSGYFVHNWLDSIESHASTIVSNIEHDLTSSKYNYNYGLLTLKHGGGGHVLVPLAVTHSGAHTYIEVYNPNTPCTSIPNTANAPKVDIVGDNWSYDMGSDGVWTGTNDGLLGLVDNGMGYIAYHGPDDGWTDQISSLSGLSEVIFGSDVSVDQVSDSKGRKLIINGKVDVTDQGLGSEVVLLPNYAAAETPKRPRSGDPSKVLKVAPEKAGSAAQQALLAQFDKDYAQDYEKSGLVYVVTDKNLTDLTFTLSSKKTGKPVRALINQGGQFIEVKSAEASGSDLIHPSLTVHSLADLAKSGVTLNSSDAKVLKVTFTHGLYDDQAKTETLQQSSDVAIKTAIKAQVSGNELELSTAEKTPAAATVSKRTISVDAKVTQAPIRQLTTTPIQ